MKKLIYNLLSKGDNIIILVSILMMVCILAISPFLPDSRPERLRNELSKQGYNVEHIDFEFVESINNNVWIFSSSEPIIHDGYYVRHWQLTRRTVGISWPNMRTVYSVEAYQPNLNQ